ncbi:hypothetical protein GGF37_004266 [Kickxella alabastrina]|nr:hypothetical protein GGF37_004266 [Kickxella alabastrina]
MFQFQPMSLEPHMPPMPTFGRRPSVTNTQLYNTSSYKYAIFDLDKTSKEVYSPANTNNDDFASLRSFLPVYNCCYAVYKLTFVKNMRSTSVVIFYTWLPAEAAEAEKQRYLANSNEVAQQLSHYDFKFECTEWREFQHFIAVSKVNRYMKTIYK